jgi:uncharacterized tellurite resistance protein B-like protein
MIIFGTRGVKSTIEEGIFNCPQCEANKDYKLKKVFKFFTLLFMPLIPLGKKGEYVECSSCKGTFIPNVLNYQSDNSSDKVLAEYEKTMKHCMVLIMLADGQIDPNEMSTVLRIINKFGHNDLTLNELEEYVRQVERDQEDVSTYLIRVTPSLNDHGKEIIIKCALAVASSDGNIDKAEFAVIKKMSKTMEMSNSHFKSILHEMMTPTSSFSDS